MHDFLVSIEQLSFSTWVRESDFWGYATILFAHVISLGVVAGLSIAIDLRLLGLSPNMPVKPLDRLHPFIWWGFVVSAITGIPLLMQDASTKLASPVFYVKMSLIAVGLVLLRLIRSKVFNHPALDQGPLPAGTRGLALASLVCWLAVITAGRLMAYLGPVAGLAASR